MIIGPYTDPAGGYVVEQEQMLVMFEVIQPPPGTPQPQRKVTYAIFDINRTFVGPDSLFYKIVDPNPVYAVGDDVALWSSEVHPISIIGKHRPHSSATRDISGSMMINPSTT